ncbi:MAG: hypothetical protein C5B54_10950 [Acidobacteria bacterium]|nr:MAG: hypothetical protein C5B54_10950 [Acidobacteriota bacterium]
MRTHPNATAEKLRDAGFGSDLFLLYRNRMRDVRSDAGVRSKAEMIKEKITAAIRNGSTLTPRQVSRMQHYGWTADSLRKEAGLIKNGYVSAAESRT